MRDGMRYFAVFAIAVLSVASGPIGLTTAAHAGTPMLSTHSTHNSDITPLLAAVENEDVARVRELLQAGANPDDPAAGRSPLIMAITSFNPRVSMSLRCNIRLVKLLLHYGADPNRPDPRIGSLPLLTAIDVGSMPCVHIIKDAGGRVGTGVAGRYNLLMSAVGVAARTGDMKYLDLAISWGSNLNERSPYNGDTALHEAVLINSANVTEALLARGADPCIRDNLGLTPLDMAISVRRSEAIIRVLTPVTHCGKDGHPN